MNGIRYVIDDKGRKVAVQIDLKKYGTMLEDFWAVSYTHLDVYKRQP